MELFYEEYKARKVINVHKHVDGPWFWGLYNAHPYVGCRSGCEFCYERGGVYIGRRDPDRFDTHIRVKVNAVELFKKELPGLNKEIISCGDWQQPAEKKYRLSRGMLEVVLENTFPLFIIERSPFLLRDLDLLEEINRKSWVGVLFSISGVDPVLKRAFEPHSPGVKQRLEAMAKLSSAGITTGAAMMPVFPFVGDQEKQLEETVRAVKDHGGSCVLAGGLTMAGAQAARTLEVYRQIDPALEEKLRIMYRWAPGGKPGYGPPVRYSARLGLKVRELCSRFGLLDRLPRYVPPGPLAANKRIAEKLFLETYEQELRQASSYRIWAYRKAAWAVDELDEDIAGLYAEKGIAGLEKIPGVGKKIAARIEKWLDEL
jgi:DNA repair photolyase